jgi:anti-anti-sigma factor
MDLSVRSTTKDGRTILHVDGDVDAMSLKEFTTELQRSVAAEGPDVVVDLRDVTFVDSIGLGALDRARRVAERHHGRVSLLASRQVRRVLNVTGLTGVFTVHRSMDEATGRR